LGSKIDRNMGCQEKHQTPFFSPKIIIITLTPGPKLDIWNTKVPLKGRLKM
jgi:hypothetical protein